MSDAPDVPEARPTVESVTQAMLDSYEADERMRHIDTGPLPSRAKTIQLLEMLRDLLFPGYYGARALTRDNVREHVSELVGNIRTAMEPLVDEALQWQAWHLAGGRKRDGDQPTFPRAAAITDEFMANVPKLRKMLSLDVQAAFDGDPAAISTDETVYCYPGVDAVFTYRVAHELHRMGVRLLPRIMTEYVHNETGIDIHPGATIGESFFIDHGTGVVIGETTHIGNRVKLYQGVTLGAMSFARDEEGRLIRGTKRHPTIEDDVTIYANATILGGSTVIGAGSIIGGSVFITKSVPPGHYVTLKTQELKYRSAEMHDRLAVQRKDD